MGSSCTTLAKRLYNHKNKAKRETSRRVYDHLNKVGWENVDIVLVELYPCESKMELERRERYWIEDLKPSLNRNVPTRTDAEYYHEAYREKTLENQKNWRKANPDRKRELDAQYREANRDKVRESNLKYYEANRDAINTRRRERWAQGKAERESEAQSS